MNFRTFSKLSSLTVATAAAFTLVACGLGGSADIGADNQQSNGDDDAGKTNVPVQGTGGATDTGHSQTGKAGSYNQGGPNGGATSVGGASGVGGTANGGGAAGGIRCGSAICGSGEYCCNESCSQCAPVGAFCTTIFCGPTPAVDAGPAQCLPFAPCAKGSTWSMKTCDCVPDQPEGSACLTNADCVAVSDYCEGCNCLALGKDEKPPVCNGQTVSCFADPCMTLTAACTGGVCTTVKN